MHRLIDLYIQVFPIVLYSVVACESMQSYLLIQYFQSQEGRWMLEYIVVPLCILAMLMRVMAGLSLVWILQLAGAVTFVAFSWLMFFRYITSETSAIQTSSPTLLPYCNSLYPSSLGILHQPFCDKFAEERKSRQSKITCV